MKRLFKEIKGKISYKKVLVENFIFYHKNKATLPENIKKECVILLGTPEYGNLGDQLIAFAELCLLHDIFGTTNVFEITENDIRYRFNTIAKLINHNNLLVLQGGGNISDVWSDQEDIREKILKKFPDKRIILMPQTVYILNEEKKQSILAKYNQSILLCAREIYSFKFLKNAGKNNVLLCPDITLYLWEYCIKYRKNRKRHKIGVCLRKDMESITNKNDKYVVNYLQSLNYEAEIFTTVKGIYISSRERKLEIDAILSYISERELIITDRLHSMIMAYLVGTPCIALSNSNKKVEGCYKWISDADNIYFTTDIIDGLAHVKDIIGIKNTSDFKYKDLYMKIFKSDMEQRL